MLMRTIAAWLAVIGAIAYSIPKDMQRLAIGDGRTMRERLFIAFAWLPKATVQAALAPVFYDAAIERVSGNVPTSIEQEKIDAGTAVR